ncbi:hypothetical protein RJ641_000878 [Dillenia turbinata]|uniref:TmcB/TmcC TPR repeats domain-containing protein n=1 Tax=Dillenia turbinata TaxID=194707 RepID=A0AAN8W7H5_9MAGN
MRAVLVRTGSVQVLSGSPRASSSLLRHDSGKLFSGEKNAVSSPRISLHLEVKSQQRIHRASSEADMIRSESDLSSRFSSLKGLGSRSLPVRIEEEEYVDESAVNKCWSLAGIGVEEELGNGGGGMRKGGISGGDGGVGGGSGGGNADWREIGEYYKEMLKWNPNDSLLLRNYGKYLHEVERDTERAEEYYGRAILASPGDGEVLSLYGQLIWETERDGGRAKSYFDQAVNASPNDCMVLGSYAHFLWESEEEEEEEEEVGREAELVGAF